VPVDGGENGETGTTTGSGGVGPVTSQVVEKKVLPEITRQTGSGPDWDRVVSDVPRDPLFGGRPGDLFAANEPKKDEKSMNPFRRTAEDGLNGGKKIEEPKKDWNWWNPISWPIMPWN
jgi:hypothetical protein